MKRSLGKAKTQRRSSRKATQAATIRGAADAEVLKVTLRPTVRIPSSLVSRSLNLFPKTFSKKMTRTSRTSTLPRYFVGTDASRREA